jgi:hypothetical protein
MSDEDLAKIKRDYLNSLWDDYKDSISKFDDQSLLISGGALGISLTFVKDIVPLDQSIHLWLFVLALICFVLTILFGFINHIISANTIKRTHQKASANDFTKPINNKIAGLNIFIAGSLVTGLILLVLYCTINIANYKEKKGIEYPNTINLNIK